MPTDLTKEKRGDANPAEPDRSSTSPTRRVRRQLFALVAGVILFSGVVLVLILASLRAQAIHAGERLTESFAHVIAEQTDSTLRSIDLRLQLASSHFAQASAAGRLNEGSGRGLLREEIKGLKSVRALSVADAQGRVLYTSDSAAPGWSVADRAYFQLYRGEPLTGFSVGVPVRGQVSGAWLISATRPLRSADGAFAGVIVAAVEPAYFDGLWRKVDLGAFGSIALFRRDGLLMMRSPFDDAVMGRNFGDRPLFGGGITAKPDGNFRDTSPIDGIGRMLAYRTLSGNRDLLVVVGRSYDLVLAPWRQLATIALSTWALACVVILMMGASLNKSWLKAVRSEVSLEEMAQRLAHATEASSIGVWDWDLQADRWYATPTFFAMLGSGPETRGFTPEEWLDYIHPEDRAKVATSIETALTGADVPYRYEARARQTDGSFRWVSVIGRVLARDEKGQPRRLIGVMMDVTETKRAEKALRDSEAFTHSILDSVSPEIAVVDREGVIIAVNEPWIRFARENGLQPGEPAPRTGVGVNYLDACRDATSPGALQAGEGIRAVLDGRSPAFRQEYPCHSGTVQRWFIIAATPLRPDGRGAVVAHVDVTERLLAEATVRASLREKEALLKEVHHRVKNNLQVILSLLRLETSRAEVEATRTVLREMQGRIRSMALLHETLYRTGNFARVDLADYLGQMATQLLRAQNSGPGVQLKLDLSPVKLEIDQAIPCGLIVNELLTNSLKHGFPDGRAGEIRVLLERDEGGWVRLRVSDTGVGLAPDFDAKKSRSLGLHLVSDLARQLGGELTVGPPPVAAFDLTFPSGRQETVPISTEILRGIREGRPPAKGA